jgi:hypothetical protein
MPPARTHLSLDRPRFAPERVLFAVAAMILLLGSQLPLTSYVSPKNGVGYALGVVGGVMLLFQSFYTIRKRVPGLAFLGSIPAWFQWHILLGIAAPVLILIHCGFSLGATNSNIALFSMLLVAGSGLFGRFLYTRIHRGAAGKKTTLAELQRSAREIQERGSKVLIVPELIARLDAEESRLSRVGDWRGPAIVAAPFVIRARSKASERLMRDCAHSAIEATAARHKAVAAQKERFERVAFDHISQRLRTTREVAEFRVFEKCFGMWHALHVPLFFILIAASIVHVVAVHLY